MTKKQFALILAVWFAVMGILYAVPARSEQGLVQTKGTVTCDMAKKDLLAVGIRLNHLKDEFVAESDDNIKFVIREEAKYLGKLGTVINMWMKENCRDA